MSPWRRLRRHDWVPILPHHRSHYQYFSTFPATAGFCINQTNAPITSWNDLMTTGRSSFRKFFAGYRSSVPSSKSFNQFKDVTRPKIWKWITWLWPRLRRRRNRSIGAGPIQQQYDISQCFTYNTILHMPIWNVSMLTNSSTYILSMILI